MNVIISNKFSTELSSLDIDVIKTLNGEFTVEELANTFSNFYYNRMIIDITSIKGYLDINVIQKLCVNFDMSKIILFLEEGVTTSNEYLSKLVSMGIYNFTKTIDNIKYLIDNPNSYKDVAHIQQLQEVTSTIVEKVEMSGCKVIGIKNITDHAGATTLIYMIKKQLSDRFKTIAIEINKVDFGVFNDSEMISVNEDKFLKTLAEVKNYDIILVDLNDSDDDASCDDILYLIEPSTIKLNKMIRRNRNIFETLKGKKIVLNKSLLDKTDLADFEYESKSEIYYNIPPLDDKENKHEILEGLFSKMGLTNMQKEEVKDENKILGLFKF